MKPPKKIRDFETVPVDKWMAGTITAIEHDPAHMFGGGPTANVNEAIRITFSIDGLRFPHRTGWMTFSYGPGATLLERYLKSLVDGARADMDFDIEDLRSMRVETLWRPTPRGKQDVAAIRPLGEKLRAGRAA
ncbi:MAG TPA: hypothetical protein VFN81_08715 [Sphingomicrobium sp.]|nr:hypothetical protein [Sphingomicrobium sp.]